MIAPVTHILPLARIRRSRMLPGKGYVVAHPGQQVNATDVVAEVNLPGTHVLLDIRRALGIQSIEETHKLIDRQVGDKVEKGDIIAQMGGILPRVIRAPSSGVVVAIKKGQVLLEEYGKKFELRAGMNGVVSEVLPDRGVVVEGNGALIQGVWGNQKINIGLLVRQAETADSELTRANLNVSLRGAIVLAGFVGKADTLTTAQELPVKGLILSSMSSHLVPLAMKAEFPIILIEGFGKIPMNSKAFNLLAKNEKSDVSLNANWDSLLGNRPEIFIPLPAEGNPVLDTAEFLPGKTVRIHSAPFCGAVGTISYLRPGQTSFENGLRAQAAEIRLENSQLVSVPLANLDVLE
jgi:hypothetical protein